MTTWVEPEGGRERGLWGLAKSFTQVLVNPGGFFREAVSPGDQAPGLAFGMTVVLLEESTRLALHPAAALDFPTADWLAALLTVALAVLLVTPAAIHALSAVQTLALVAVAPDRGGVSETVQVIAYAAAPCVLAGVGVPAVTAIATLWSFALLVYGTSVVHEISLPRAFAAAVVPGALAFGSGFGGIAAAEALADAAATALAL
ncbi:MAG: YIP1 family protein [Halobacterium sp.]